MNNKIIPMVAAVLMLSATPVLAEGRTDHDGPKGKHRGEAMFEKHDVNGDGAISKDEFMKSAEERFGKMDADGDGSFTKDEAEAAKEKMKEKRKDRKAERKSKRGPMDRETTE